MVDIGCDEHSSVEPAQEFVAGYVEYVGIEYAYGGGGFILHQSYVFVDLEQFFGYGFGGVGQATHGQHNRLRAPGSIGACSYPAKVFKGMRMAGQTGNERVTVQNLKVVKIIPEHNVLMIKGSIPGSKGSIVMIEK